MISIKVNKRKDRISYYRGRTRVKVAAIMAEGAQRGAAIAKQLCPVRTGFLQSSIFIEQRGEMQFGIGAGADYALFVEYGTINMEARPFITPSREAVRPWITGRLRRLEHEIA